MASSTPEYVINPAINDTAMTEDVCKARLGKVIFWAPKSGAVTHWRTSFVFKEKVGKIVGMSADMYQPKSHEFYIPEDPSDLGNRFGSLQLKTSTDKLTSRSPAVVFEFVVQGEATVQQLLDIIRSRHMQYYKFHPMGSGCLFWQLTLVEYMREMGWIKQGEKERLIEKIEEFRAQSDGNAGMIPWPPRQGEFYTPPT